MTAPADDPNRLENALRQVASAGKQAAAVQELVHTFNDKYFVVNEAGSVHVFAERHDDQLNRIVYDRLSVPGLRVMYSNRKLMVGSKPRSAADIWLNHPHRRSYLNGVTFDPSMKERDGVLNLWKGFHVTAKQGNWNLLREHIRTDLCDGNEEVFAFVLPWLARMMQHPELPAETALVFRGAEGSGKGIVIRAMMHLLGQHAMHISSSRHLVGNFNEHLRDCVLLYADEAFFAGDKAHVGALKRLITEPTITIEIKGGRVHDVKNFLHIVLTSNERWVVPAGIEARRFMVVDVSAAHKGDTAYFGAIQQQLDNGGYEAMLYDLLHHDISGFDHRTVPKTAALQDQTQQSLPVEIQWLQHRLFLGHIYDSQYGLFELEAWWEVAPTELLFKSYERFAKEHGERNPMNVVSFGRFLSKMFKRKRLQTRKPVVVGEYLDRGGSQPTAKPLVKTDLYGYELGTLDKCRETFCRHTGLQIDWPPDDPSQWEARRQARLDLAGGESHESITDARQELQTRYTLQ